jgi:hypothetical protein
MKKRFISFRMSRMTIDPRPGRAQPQGPLSEHMVMSDLKAGLSKEHPIFSRRPFDEFSP